MRLHHPRFMYPPDPTDLHESGCRVGVSGLPAGSHLHSPEWPVDADFSQWHVGWSAAGPSGSPSTSRLLRRQRWTDGRSGEACISAVPLRSSLPACLPAFVERSPFPLRLGYTLVEWTPQPIQDFTFPPPEYLRPSRYITLHHLKRQAGRQDRSVQAKTRGRVSDGQI